MSGALHRIEVGISEADGIKNAIITDLGITDRKVLSELTFTQ